MSVVNRIITNKALSYTSRGNKFVYHPEQIRNFLENNGKSIISTHIAPTNACNLNCSYCNQSNRTKSAFLNLETIKNFVLALKERGLKAAIVTGGGEPTLYPQFNELINWLDKNILSTALITNGTNDKCGKEKISTWDLFSWIRVSLNFANNKLRPIKVPESQSGKIGFSMVYKNQPYEAFEDVANVAEKYNARYVRIIPDCCTSKEIIETEQENLKKITAKLQNPRFFIQEKIPTQTTIPICHQSKLRPFLLPDGSVAPCDCYMLNKNSNGDYYKTLPEHFNLAPDKSNPASYIDYLDGKFSAQFNPVFDCNGCGFIENNLILDKLIELHNMYPERNIEELFSLINLYPDKNVNDINFV